MSQASTYVKRTYLHKRTCPFLNSNGIIVNVIVEDNLNIDLKSIYNNETLEEQIYNWIFVNSKNRNFNIVKANHSNRNIYFKSVRIPLIKGNLKLSILSFAKRMQFFLQQNPFKLIVKIAIQNKYEKLIILRIKGQ